MKTELKGISVSLAITFLSVALIALIIKAFDVTAQMISASALAIKLISVISGALYVALKSNKNAVWGAILLSALYWCVNFCFFASRITLLTACDLIFTLFTGFLCGVAGKLITRKKQKKDSTVT